MNAKELADRQLGMHVGTAHRQLHKMLLFKFAQKCSEDICFRCGKKIESAEEVSLDHKVGWRHEINAKELFWDINNLALSHLRCNISIQRRQRFVTARSGYKGVYPAPRRQARLKPWTARVQGANHYIHVGYFRDAKEAAKAYDEALIKKDGADALTNKKLGLLP